MGSFLGTILLVIIFYYLLKTIGNIFRTLSNNESSPKNSHPFFSFNKKPSNHSHTHKTTSKPDNDNNIMDKGDSEYIDFEEIK